MFEALVIGLHIATAHSDWGSGLNNVNPGVYVQADGWAGGVYRNSVRRNSVWLGRVFETKNKRYALTVGGATGYDYIAGTAFCPPNVVLAPGKFCYRTGPKVAPLIAPSVRVDLGNSVAMRVSYLAGGVKHAHGLHFSLEF